MQRRFKRSENASLCCCCRSLTMLITCLELQLAAGMHTTCFSFNGRTTCKTHSCIVDNVSYAMPSTIDILHLRHFVHDRRFFRIFGGSAVVWESGIAEGDGSKILVLASEGSMVSSSCFRTEHSTWGRQWWPSTVDNSWQLQPISTWSVLQSWQNSLDVKSRRGSEKFSIWEFSHSFSISRHL
jgi:hypothetical protein